MLIKKKKRTRKRLLFDRNHTTWREELRVAINGEPYDCPFRDFETQCDRYKLVPNTNKHEICVATYLQVYGSRTCWRHIEIKCFSAWLDLITRQPLAVQVDTWWLFYKLLFRINIVDSYVIACIYDKIRRDVHVTPHNPLFDEFLALADNLVKFSASFHAIKFLSLQWRNMTRVNKNVDRNRFCGNAASMKTLSNSPYFEPQPLVGWWFANAPISLLDNWLKTMEAFSANTYLFKLPCFREGLIPLATHLCDTRWNLLVRAFAICCRPVFVSFCDQPKLTEALVKRLAQVLLAAPLIYFRETHNDLGMYSFYQLPDALLMACSLRLPPIIPQSTAMPRFYDDCILPRMAADLTAWSKPIHEYILKPICDNIVVQYCVPFKPICSVYRYG